MTTEKNEYGQFQLLKSTNATVEICIENVNPGQCGHIKMALTDLRPATGPGKASSLGGNDDFQVWDTPMGRYVFPVRGSHG